MSARVVITGLGAVTPMGLSFESSWKTALAGQCGIAEVARFRIDALPSVHAGEVKGFDPLVYISRKDVLRFDRFVQLGYAAAKMAAEDAGNPDLSGAGVFIGSGRGGITSVEAGARGRASAYLMAGSTVSMAASLCAERLQARGPILGISNACASGANAIAEAALHIKAGRVRLALAGGAEAPLCPVSIRGYGASGALSMSGRIRPFSPERDGFVLGEGGAVLVLEERQHAINRGARIYAEFLGFGNTADAYHPTRPSAKGQEAAIRAALDDAGIGHTAVSFISAHATGTLLGDSAEAEALAAVFGPRLPHVYALKALTGHMLAASGAFEVLSAARGLYEQRLPARVLGEASGENIEVAMADSFGFGGVNIVIALGRHT